jgi:hypothetical protein
MSSPQRPEKPLPSGMGSVTTRTCEELEARVEGMISNARKYDDELFEAQSIKARRIFDLGMSFGIEFFTGDDDEEPNPNWAQLENHDIPPLGTIHWKVTGRGQSTEEAIVHALLLALAEKVAELMAFQKTALVTSGEMLEHS